MSIANYFKTRSRLLVGVAAMAFGFAAQGCRMDEDAEARTAASVKADTPKDSKTGAGVFDKGPATDDSQEHGAYPLPKQPLNRPFIYGSGPYINDPQYQNEILQLRGYHAMNVFQNARGGDFKQEACDASQNGDKCLKRETDDAWQRWYALELRETALESAVDARYLKGYLKEQKKAHKTPETDSELKKALDAQKEAVQSQMTALQQQLDLMMAQRGGASVQEININQQVTVIVQQPPYPFPETKTEASKEPLPAPPAVTTEQPKAPPATVTPPPAAAEAPKAAEPETPAEAPKAAETQAPEKPKTEAKAPKAAHKEAVKKPAPAKQQPAAKPKAAAPKPADKAPACQCNKGDTVFL